jgi:hypothetical protein
MFSRGSSKKYLRKRVDRLAAEQARINDRMGLLQRSIAAERAARLQLEVRVAAITKQK